MMRFVGVFMMIYLFFQAMTVAEGLESATRTRAPRTISG
jgi:hypothetical protein